MKKSDAVYPGFLYIGVARAGSTWIYECLHEHPEIYVPAAKDIEIPSHIKQKIKNFASRDYDKLSGLIGRKLPSKWSDS